MTLREQFQKETGKDPHSAQHMTDYINWLENKINNQELVKRVNCRIIALSGGDAGKSLNESIIDEAIVKELQEIQNLL